MIGPDGLKLIDHGHTFMRGDEEIMRPTYMDDYAKQGKSGAVYKSPIHPAAHQWTMSLDPDMLAAQMQLHGAPPDDIRAVERRLRLVQAQLRGDPNVSRRQLVG